MQRFKPPVSQWIVDERKRHGWKVDELSRRLVEMGYEAQPSTVQVWEAGRSPKGETIDALERLFGSAAPRAAELSGDLASAIREQTAAMRELVAELREAREAQQGRDEGLAAALGELSGTLARLRLAPDGTSRKSSG